MTEQTHVVEEPHLIEQTDGVEESDGIEDILPLTPMQQGMLFHSDGSSDYLQQFIVDLTGPADPGVMRAAWQAVIDRHAALRAVFLADEADEPIQAVLRDVEVPFRTVVWQDAGDLESWLEADRADVFDPALGPLLRVTLGRTADGPDERWILVWTFHHVLLDGWSVTLVLDQVMSAYRALVDGAAVPEAPTGSFPAFVAWQRKQDPAAAERFWRAELAGADPARFRAPRNGSARIGTGELVADLSAAATDALGRLARDTRTTVSSWTLTAWTRILAACSGSPEVVVGVVTAGRSAPLPDIGSTVGLLVNTVPVRVPGPGRATVAQAVAQVMAAQLRADEFGHCGPADVHRWSGMPAGTPLFDSLYAFENYPAGDAGGVATGLRIEGIRSVESPGYPLSLSVTVGSRLGLRLVHDRALCPEPAARRILDLFQHVLERMAAEPHRSLRDLPLLDAAAEDRLREWNRTGTAYPRDRSLPSVVSDQVAARPDAVAVSDEHSSLSYAGLDRCSRVLAGRLRAAGVGSSDRVGLCLTRTPLLAAAILATVRLGAVYVPVDARYPEDRVAHMVTDSGMKVMLVDHGTRTVAPDTAVPRLQLDLNLEQGPGPGPAPGTAEHLAGPPAMSAACLEYTSGSTGQPKGILLTHRGIMRTVAGSTTLPLRPDDTVAQICNTSFDPFAMELWGALLNGARLHFVPDGALLDPALMERTLVREQITVGVIPMAPLREIVRTAPAAFRGLRHLVTGAEAVDPAVLRTILETGPPQRVVNGYGPTEGTIVSTSWRIRGVPTDSGPVPIGRPVSNTRVYLLDRSLRQAALGTVAELAVGGDGVALGYLGQPGRTAEAFRPDPFGPEPGARMYLTGDEAVLRDDGELDFLGRGDGQVKIRGFRVEPGETETVLAGHPLARQCVVRAENGPGRSGTTLVAYVVGHRTLGQGDLGDLRAHMAARLPDYMVPSAVVPVPGIPLTPNGKLDREALGRYRPAPAAIGEAPRSPAETTLAALFARALGQERVGRADHFLDLGGDSILAIGVAARAVGEGLSVTAQDVLRLGTPAALALAAAAGDEPVPQEDLEGTAGLTPVQRQFLERELPDPHFYSQAVLLTAPAGCSAKVLEPALRAVLSHHDALRLRPATIGGKPRLRYLPTSEIPLTVREFDSRSPEVILRETTALQRLLGVTGDRAPLVAGVFTGDPEGHGEPGDRVFLAAHHLFVDVVSWEILVHDIELAHQQIAAGVPVRLPAKTHSAARWVEHLTDWTRTGEAADEAAWWHRALGEAHRVKPLPADGVPSVPAGREATAATVTVLLDRSGTEALTAGHGAARLPDLLVTALAWGCRAWTGQDQVLLALEGHGRNPLGGERLNLARTVGWFTALHPLLIDLTDRDDIDIAAAAVVEQLRAVPHGGVGHGALRHLAPGTHGAPLAGLPEPQIAVNYVGAFADRVATGGWTWASEALGPERGPDNPRSHALVVTGHLDQGRLRVTFEYSTELHHRRTVETLAEHVRTALSQLSGAPRVVGLDAGQVRALLDDLDLLGDRGPDDGREDPQPCDEKRTGG
ncbi:amino acid adenylation domain-containing protein [Streptomyces tendae]